MNIILQTDVKNLGQMGDIVKVKDGYGRNYLIPRGLAVIADERNQKKLNHQKSMADSKAAKERLVSESLATQISENPVSFIREAGEDDKLFGSVTNRDIAEALSLRGIEIDRRRIKMSEPFKSMGRFEIEIALDRGVKATITVFIQR